MKLTKQTYFALRTLIYVAQNAEDRRVFAKEISDAHEMPINHLTKIIHKMSQLDYLVTYRGRNGGIELGKDPKEILIRTVIEDFEPKLNPDDCMNCVLFNDCVLKDDLKRASQAFLNSLGQKSLADII